MPSKVRRRPFAILHRLLMQGLSKFSVATGILRREWPDPFLPFTDGFPLVRFESWTQKAGQGWALVDTLPPRRESQG